jgi:hypothetical protein
MIELMQVILGPASAPDFRSWYRNEKGISFHILADSGREAGFTGYALITEPWGPTVRPLAEREMTSAFPMTDAKLDKLMIEAATEAFGSMELLRLLSEWDNDKPR